MQVKSIAECSEGSILQYFRPSLSFHLSLRSGFCLLFEWPFYTGFTVYSYTNNLFCIFQALEYCPSDINVVLNVYISGLGGTVIDRGSAPLYDDKPTSYVPSEDLDQPGHQLTHFLTCKLRAHDSETLGQIWR